MTTEAPCFPRLLYGDQAKFFDMEAVPRMKHRTVGTVSMVNNGGNMHGSQVPLVLRKRKIQKDLIKMSDFLTVYIVPVSHNVLV